MRALITWGSVVALALNPIVYASRMGAMLHISHVQGLDSGGWTLGGVAVTFLIEWSATASRSATGRRYNVRSTGLHVGSAY